MATPLDQSRYQVRFEWGATGLERLAPADVVVVVDVLSFSTAVADLVATRARVPLDDRALAASRNGAPIARRAAESGAVVLLGCLRNATAVADAVMAEQQRRGQRTSIAVLAAGELSSASGAEARFAVEDQLGAGAIIDALGARGIDHTAPEAAAACESFRGLKGALRHLLTASGSGQELLETGRREEVLHAAERDAVAVAPRLVDGVFTA